MTDTGRQYTLPPRSVQPYVDVLGTETTVAYLLAFGGSEIFLAGKPKGRGMVERVLGF